MCVFDFKGIVLDANPAFERVLGWSVSELKGKGIRDFLHPDDRESATLERIQLMQGEPRSAASHRFRTKAGHYVFLEWTARPDPSEGVVYGVARDVTPMREAREALEQSRAAYKTLFEEAPYPTLVVDRRTLEFLEVNRMAVEFYGYSQEEFEQMTLLDLRVPEEREATGKRISERQHRFEFLRKVRHVMKDGSIRWIDAATHMFQYYGRDAYLGTIIDRTEALKAEEELQVLRTCIERLNDAVLVTDACDIGSGGPYIVFVNEAFEKLCGYSSHELIGRNPRVLQGPETDPSVVQRLRSAIIERRPERVEVVNYASNGRQYWVELDLTPVFDDDGECCNFVAVQRDVTERLQQQKTLMETMQKAEAASRAKSSFLAMMSHELRTPLNPILGFADLLHDMEEDDEKRQFLASIIDSATHLRTLLGDILDLARMDSEKDDVSLEALNLRDVVTQLVQIKQAEIENAGLEWSLRFEDNVPGTVMSDPKRLRQILINLLGNARKFTEIGSVRLTVRRCDESDLSFPQDRVRMGDNGADVAWTCFEISDTGIGIETRYLTQIFEPFFQVDNSFTRRFEGSGLGLSVASQLAFSLGGWIDVESEPGRGSTFTAVIPMLIPTDNATEPAASEVLTSGEDVTARPVPSSCILTVEDDPMSRDVLDRMLRFGGHQVRGVGSAEEALEILRSVDGPEVDAMIVDLHMPGMDGFELIRIVREEALMPLDQLIVITADAARSARDELQALGVEWILYKPVSLKRLAQALPDVFARKKE